jgi:hypothetical protein
MRQKSADTLASNYARGIAAYVAMIDVESGD